MIFSVSLFRSPSTSSVLWIAPFFIDVCLRNLHNPWQRCHESPQCGIDSLTSTLLRTLEKHRATARFFSRFHKLLYSKPCQWGHREKPLPGLAPSAVSLLILFAMLPLASWLVASSVFAPPPQNFNLTMSHWASDWLPDVYIISRVM